MPNLLDTLEALERQATPGPHRTSSKFLLGGCVVIDGDGEWLAEFEREEDAVHYVAARNALPALLRVARAAREYDTALIANTTQKERARLARELRAALAAFDAAGEGE